MSGTRFKCRRCGKLTAGRLPRASWEPGDGSVYMPRRHKLDDGSTCPGVFESAIEVSESGREYDPEEPR